MFTRPTTAAAFGLLVRLGSTPVFAQGRTPPDRSPGLPFGGLQHQEPFGYPQRPGGPPARDDCSDSPYAQVLLEHGHPEQVWAELGVRNGNLRPIRVTFRDEGVDIVRSRHEPERGLSGGTPVAGLLGPVVEAKVDLSPYARWLDGRQEWYLRLTDRCAQPGVLRAFEVVTAGGTARIRNVPAMLHVGRPLEARLTPEAQFSSPPGGGHGWEQPARGERQLPSQVRPGEQVAIELRFNLPARGRIGKLDVREQLPAGWQITRVEPYTNGLDTRRGQVFWRLVNPRPEQRFVIYAIAPRTGSGLQTFTGLWRIDDEPVQATAGPSQVYLIATPPPRPGYDRPHGPSERPYQHGGGRRDR